MRIQLERKLPSCRDKLRCTVCQQIFVVGQIRSLLYQNSGLLQGDVCPTCAKLSAKDFKETMIFKARVLLQEDNLRDAQTMTRHEQALELLEIAKEPIKFPSFWQQLLTQLDVLAQDTQELEAARLGLHGDRYHPRSHPRLFFEDDRAQN